ncbi:unnamed protein product, partial [Ixodes hexagonus]
PPTAPVIRDGQGNVIRDVIGPYDEGSALVLSCEVRGGEPPPKLVWSGSGYALSQPRMEQERTGDVTKHTLLIGSLDRKLVLSVFACHVAGSPEPLNATVTLDMNLRPLSVRLWNPENATRAGMPSEFRCRVLGSRPSAVVTWWLGTNQMEPFFLEESSDGSDTFSVLIITPTVEDDEQVVRCLATHSRIQDVGLEETWKLDVRYPPSVTLQLGKGLREPVIEEGRDLYFECVVRANPAASLVRWFHDGALLELAANETSRMLSTGRYLVVRNVRPTQAGAYSCSARNALATAMSNSVLLTVQYIPRCQNIWSSTSTNGTETTVSCRVVAVPEEVSFVWSLRDGSKAEQVAVDDSDVWVNGSLSAFTVVHGSHGVVGDVTVYCRARNSLGLQRSPCVLVVDTKEKPGSLGDCSVSNQSEYRLLVSCSHWNPRPGDRYLLEVQTAARLSFSVTRETPSFWIPNLEPGAESLLLFYVVNGRGGRGEPLKLTVHTDPYTAPLASAEKRPSSALGTSALLGLVMASLSAMLLAPAR